MERARKRNPEKILGNAKPLKGFDWIRVLLLLAAVLFLAAGGVVYASYHRMLTLPDFLQVKVDLMPDASAKSGTPHAGKTDAGSAETSVDSGNFQVVINKLPTMENGSAPCNLHVENPESNPYDLRICLYLEDTGELLGATHRIERGKRVEELKLDPILLPGEYEVLAQFDLLDDKQEAVSRIAVPLSLLVKGE